MIMHLHNIFLLSTPIAQMLLPSRWVNGGRDVKKLLMYSSAAEQSVLIISI